MLAREGRIVDPPELSETATLARVHEARVALASTVAALQPGVDHPQCPEGDDADRRPLHLARAHGTQREEEGEDQQDAQGDDPEQVTSRPGDAKQPIEHANPLPKGSCADRSELVYSRRLVSVALSFSLPWVRLSLKR